MMTFGKIAAGAPSAMSGMTKHMLTQTVPREVADLSRYYTRENELGENEARVRRDMHPLAAQGLGLNPELPVGMDEINALLSGRRADGEKIEGKTYSEYREYVDPKTGETKTKVPIGSVDFCLTPDKSVSVAWAFASPAEQAAIYQAHSDAANATMAYVEMHMAKAGRGKGGADGYDQGHLAWIEFDHYTARPTLDIVTQVDGQNSTERVIIDVPGDPDLHRHYTVMNAVFCENGRVGSLDLDRLEGFVKRAGALYQAHLAQNLRNMGADVALDPDTGSARLTVIPDPIRTHYSKRTTNGEEAARQYAEKNGLDWDSLSDERKAGLLKKSVQGMPKGLDADTMAKLKKDDMADFSAWKQQAAELGWTFDTIVKKQEGPELSMGPHPQINPEIRHEQAHPIAAEWLAKDLEKRAVISEHEVYTAAARSLIVTGIDSYRDMEGVVGKMLEKGVTQYGEKTTLIAGQEAGKRVLSYTTALHERDEKEFISRAKAASDNPMKALDRDRIKAAVERSGLKFEGDHGTAQLKAIHQIGEGGALSVLIGAAGAGKTTLLRPLVDAWKEDGRRIYGMALAWRQADDLIDAGISRDDTKGINDSRAMSVFLKDASSGKLELDHKSVVVVDELSLLGTRDGLNLLRLRDKHDFQLVMIGDDKQCQSITAGPIIDLARKALGSEKIPEILTTVRQKLERERDIAGLFRDGEAGRALEMKREDKTVELVQGGQRQAAQRVANLVSERMKENAANPKYSITVSAPTNSDAHQLSIFIREKRREMGLIDKKDLVTIKAAGGGSGTGDRVTYDMKLAVGDKVRLFKNVSPVKGRGSLGRNGSVLTVVNADRKGIELRNSDGKQGYVPWERLTQGGKVRLAYGEVMTTHTAQGSTATEHIYAMPQGTKAVNGFSSYSSGTRHEQKSYMVISAGAERAEVAARRPVNDPRPIKEADLWANAARNLGYQPLKTTATDFLKNATNVHRATSRAIQRGLQPGEQRQRQGQDKATVHTRTRARQEVRTVGRIAEKLEVMNRNLEPTIENLSRTVPAISVAVQQTIENVSRQQGRTPTRLSTFQPLPKEKIDELKRSVSITHLVSQRVKLDNHGKGLCHFHEEKTPSFQVDERKGTFHCFAAETKVMTPTGNFPISELSGSIQTLLTRGGVWVDAPVMSFGHQKLWKIELGRNGVLKTIYATDEHRWFLRNTKKSTLTKQLKAGDRLQHVFPTTTPVSPSDDGIRHGIVYGDGTRAENVAVVNLHDEKAEDLKGWFNGFHQRTRYRDGDKPYLAVRSFPLSFKSLPSLNESLEYLAGFVAGYLATDGHVAADGTICLNSSKASVLEYVRTICTRLGIGTYGVTEQMRLGYGTDESAIYRIHLATEHVWQSLIIRPKAAQRFSEARKLFGRYRWAVKSVEPTDRYEEVFCAVVPGEAAFALEDNILTGNCFGCGKHGDAVTWLKDGLRMSFPEALDYLSGKSGIELPKPDIQKMAAKEERWTAVLPVPEKAPSLFRSGGWTAPVYNPRAEERGLDRVSKPYKPQHVASYKDADGRQMGYVLRMEMADGSKYTPQIVWAVPTADKDKDPLKVGRWALVTMGDNRPLYRGEEIARNPSVPVIVVMGEKKADTLQASLGKGAVVVSWAGGDNGRFYTDFSALKGRNVIVWPDADAGGKAAAVGEVNSRGETKKGVAEFAKEAGATGVKVIVPPKDAAKGWDAGDLIKSGAGAKQVREFITAKAVTVDAAKKEFEPAISAAQQKQAQGKTQQVDAPTKQQTAPSQTQQKGPTRTHKGPTIRH